MAGGDAVPGPHQPDDEHLRWVIAHIAERFGVTPSTAMQYCERIAGYLAEYGQRSSELGVITYLAVAEDEPPHKSSAACRRIRVRLQLTAAADDEAHRQGGPAAVRRQRLSRLARQAQAQGALLTVEDLALLTCSSPSTMRRDLARLRQAGHAPPLREWTGGAAAR